MRTSIIPVRQITSRWFRADSGWAGLSLDCFNWRRRALLLQLLGTALALGCVTANSSKLLLMVIVWAIGFGRLSRMEWVVAALVNLVFIAMDEGALHQGIFAFRHPDAFGLPIYEFFMWGFYILHVNRILDCCEINPHRIIAALGLATSFSLCFSMITAPAMLAVAAGVVLAGSLVVFHEPEDLSFTIYMATMGALIEYVGVGTGQWSYPHAPVGGVPAWSFVMWAGIGLFSRRLLTPLLWRRTANLAKPAVS